MACEGGAEDEELWKCEGGTLRGGGAMPEFIDISVLEEQRLAPPHLSPEGALPPPAEDTDNRDAPTLEPPWQFPADEESLRVVAFVPFSKPSPEIPILQPEAPPQTSTVPDKSNDPTDCHVAEKSESGDVSETSDKPSQLVEQATSDKNASSDPEVGSSSIPKDLDDDPKSSEVDDDPKSSEVPAVDAVDSDKGASTSPEAETSIAPPDLSKNSSASMVDSKTDVADVEAYKQSDIQESSCTISTESQEPIESNCFKTSDDVESSNSAKPIDNQIVDQSSSCDTAKLPVDSTQEIIPPTSSSPNATCPAEEERGTPELTVDDSPASPDAASQTCNEPSLLKEPALIPTETQLEENCPKPVEQAENIEEKESSESHDAFHVDLSTIKEEPVTEIAIPSGDITTIKQEQTDYENPADVSLEFFVTNNDLLNCSLTSLEDPSDTDNVNKPAAIETSTDLKTEITISDITAKVEPESPVKDATSSEAVHTNQTETPPKEGGSEKDDVYLAKVEVFYEDVSEVVSEASNLKSEATTSSVVDSPTEKESNKETVAENVESSNQETPVSEETANENPKVKNTGCSTETPSLSVEEAINAEAEKFIAFDPQPFLPESVVSLSIEPPHLEKSPIASLQKAVRKIDPKKGFGSKINTIDVIAEELSVKSSKKKEEKREKKGYMQRDLPVPYPYKNHPMMMGSHPTIREFSGMMPPIPCQMPYMAMPNYPGMMPGSPMIPGMPMYPGPPCYLPPTQKPPSKLVQVKYFSGAGGMKTKFVEVPNLPARNTMYDNKVAEKEALKMKPRDDSLTPVVQKVIANRAELDVLPIRRPKQNPIIPEVVLEEGPPNGLFMSNALINQPPMVTVGGRFLDIAEAPVRCDSLTMEKARPSPKPSSEEIVFNSTDLKVILVQPESELHSSKKSQMADDGDPRQRAKIRSKKRGSLESVCEKLTKLKGEQAPELELSVVKLQEPVELVPEPSEAPEIVLLPKEANGDISDPLVSILKVPRGGETTQKTVTNGRMKQLNRNVINISSSSPKSSTPKRGRKSGVSVVRGSKSLPPSAPNTPPTQHDPSSPLVPNKEVIVSNRLSNCGGKVVVGLENKVVANLPAGLSIVAKDPVCEKEVTEAVRKTDSPDPERLAAIDRLKRLGTEVCLEVERPPSGGSSSGRVDTVLVAPGTLETEPRALELLETMAVTRALPISPVLTALGHSVVPPEVQNAAESMVPITKVTLKQQMALEQKQSELSASKKSDSKVPSNVSFVFKPEKFVQADGSFKCDICQAMYPNEDSLKKHYYQLHVALDSVAQRGVSTKSKAKDKSQLGKGILRCHFCKLRFSSKEAVRDHLVAKHGVTDKSSNTRNGPPYQFSCPRCSQTFRWRKMLSRHRRMCGKPSLPKENCLKKSANKASSETVQSNGDATDPSKSVSTSQAAPTAEVTNPAPSGKEIKDPVGSKEKSKEKVVCAKEKESDTSPKTDAVALATAMSDSSASLIESVVKTEPSSENPEISESSGTDLAMNSSNMSASGCDEPDIPDEPVKSPPEDSGPPTHHCLYCNETFRSAYRKKNHILSQHPYTRRKHSCVFCQKILANNMAIFNHMLSDHSDQYFGCKTCKERFATPSEVVSHRLKMHSDEVGAAPSKPVAEDASNPQETKDYFFQCDRCERTFLVQTCLAAHNCSGIVDRSKDKLPKKPPRPVELRPRAERLSLDASGDFFSRVAANVRDNLANYLDGKLGSTGIGSDSMDNGHRTILNFSAAVGKSGTTPVENIAASVPESIPNAVNLPARSPAWEKFTFPKEYDGRCGLTSYIKDTSYLDLSTQLIMRRNLQRLNLLKDDPPDSRDDVPGVLALERLAAQTAESYGVAEVTPPDSAANPVTPMEGGILTGEWVRDHTYVCSVCRWESTCLWTIEDHKYTAHPNVCAPHHEIQGPDHRSIIDTVYKRLLSDPPSGSSVTVLPPSRRVKFECSKCKKNDVKTSKDLHRHVVECAGEDVAALEAAFIAAAGSSSNRSRRRPRWRRGGRRSRQGLKRTVPSTPPASRRLLQSTRKPIRTKPGDSETIEKMIANLPPKRATRRVLGFDEIDLKTRSQSTIQNVGSMAMPSLLKKSSLKTPGKIQTSPSSRSPGIDTSAERGDVLSSLRMMPVRKRLAEEDAPPTLEVPPPPSEIVAEIPVLSPEPVPEPVAPSVSNKSKKRGRPFGSKNRPPPSKIIVKTAGGLIKDKVTGKMVSRVKKKLTVTVPVPSKEPTIKSMFKKVSEASQEKKTDKKVEATDDDVDKKTESPETKVIAPAKKTTPVITLKAAKTVAENKKKRKRKKSGFTHVKKHAIKNTNDEDKEASEDSATISASETPSPPAKRMRKSDRIELDDNKRRQEAKEMSEEAKRQAEESRKVEEEKRLKAEEEKKIKEEEKQRKEEEKQQRKEEEKQRKEEEKQRKEEEKQKAEEEKKRKQEEKKKADEEKKQRILEEKKRKEEEKRKKEEEKEKKKKMDEERKKKLEEEKKKKIEEDKKRKALEEEKKKKAEEEKKKKQEEEREKKRKAEEEKKRKAEEEKRKKAEEAEKQKKLEEERKKKEAEEGKRKQEQEEMERKKKEEERKQRLKAAAEERKRKKEEEEKKRLEEEARKKKEDEEKRAKAEEEKERKKKQDEERKRKLEEERERRKRKAAEEEKRKQQEEEKRLKEEELIKRLEEEKLALEEENRRIEEEVRLRSESLNEDKRERKDCNTPRQRRRREVTPDGDSSMGLGEDSSSGIRLRRRREVSPIESIGSGRESSSIGDNETSSSNRLRRKREISPIGSLGDERVSSTIEDDDTHSYPRLRNRREYALNESLGDGRERSFGDDDLPIAPRIRRRSDISIDCISERRESSSIGDTSSVGEDSEEASSEDSFGAAKRGRIRKKKISLVKRLMKKKSKVKLSPSSSSKGKEVVKMGGGMTWEVEPLMLAGGSGEEPSLMSQESSPAPVSNWSSPAHLPPPPFQPSLSQQIVTPQPQSLLQQPSQQNPVWREPTPSLGTILDSVNTLLSEPELTYSPLGLPQYSLADLQKAMGASDAEMAVLQQLGEASLHLVKNEETRPDEEEWPEIMDLDRQPPPEEQPPPPAQPQPQPPAQTQMQPSTFRTWPASQPPPNQYHPPFIRDTSATVRTPSQPPPSDGNAALLAALPGKEVVCPTCCSHFMGFPALQNHINTAHPPGSSASNDYDPPSPNGSGKLKSRRTSSGSNSSKAELGNMNTRAVLETAKESRLVCCSCQVILPANLMPGHLAVEHNLPRTDVARCPTVNSFQGSEQTKNNTGGERLKNKMSSALGDLLERAVNNLLSAKDGNNRMTGGATQLLNRLCALKKRDGSAQHKMHPIAKELLFKVNTRNRFEEVMSTIAHAPNSKPTKSYQCGICGAKFMWESTWNKHVLSSHIKQVTPGTSSTSTPTLR